MVIAKIAFTNAVNSVLCSAITDSISKASKQLSYLINFVMSKTINGSERTSTNCLRIESVIENFLNKLISID